MGQQVAQEHGGCLPAYCDVVLAPTSYHHHFSYALSENAELQETGENPPTYADAVRTSYPDHHRPASHPLSQQFPPPTIQSPAADPLQTAYYIAHSSPQQPNQHRQQQQVLFIGI